MGNRRFPARFPTARPADRIRRETDAPCGVADGPRRRPDRTPAGGCPPIPLCGENRYTFQYRHGSRPAVFPARPQAGASEGPEHGPDRGKPPPSEQPGQRRTARVRVRPGFDRFKHSFSRRIRYERFKSLFHRHALQGGHQPAGKAGQADTRGGHRTDRFREQVRGDQAALRGTGEPFLPPAQLRQNRGRPGARAAASPSSRTATRCMWAAARRRWNT